MVQWSPDTSPEDGAGGYDYRDNHLKGFSLTHLSGAGCTLYGDFPFLPTTEPIESSPAAPGPRSTASSSRVSPTPARAPARATTRCTQPGERRRRSTPTDGDDPDRHGRFNFPANPHSSILINAGGSGQPDDFASVQINPGRERNLRHRLQWPLLRSAPPLQGLLRGGLQPPLQRLWHLAAKRAQPRARPRPATPDAGGRSGDHRRRRAPTRPSTRPRARPCWSGSASPSSASKTRAPTSRRKIPASPSGRSRRAPSGAGRGLGRIRVSGGPADLLDTFYTALYHVFVAPRTFNDVNGDYLGDGRVAPPTGHTQYADFSGWDIYRTEIQLLSMLEPKRAAEMVNSLLADARQSGCLPRWPYANGQA